MASKYKKITTPDGRKIDEHRYIMERKLGRKLERWEHVHHKDENKRNNHPDDLELLDNRSHPRLHMLGCHMAAATKEKLSGINKQRQLKLHEYLPEGYSRCSVCKEILPLNAFGKDKYMYNGVYSKCKECRSKTRHN